MGSEGSIGGGSGNIGTGGSFTTFPVKEMPEETQFRPPAWQEPFRPCQIQQGARAVFRGVVTGSPAPTLSWTWRGRPLSEAGRAVTSYHPPSGQVTLAIDDLGPGDEGEYACKAENPWGDTTCTLVINPEPPATKLAQRLKIPKGSCRTKLRACHIDSDDYADYAKLKGL